MKVCECILFNLGWKRENANFSTFLIQLRGVELRGEGWGIFPVKFGMPFRRRISIFVRRQTCFFFFQSKYFFLTPFHFPLFFPNKFHSNFSFLKEFYGLLVLVKDIQHAFISFFLSYLTRLIASSHVIETLSLFLNYYISCLFTTKIVIQTCKLIVKNI